MKVEWRDVKSNFNQPTIISKSLSLVVQIHFINHFYTKPAVYIQYYWQYYETLAIYWQYRCGCSIDGEQCLINETDCSILSLHQYMYFKTFWNILIKNSDIRKLYFLLCVTFSYTVRALCILQYIVCVCAMWQSIGHHLLYWYQYMECDNSERVQRALDTPLSSI